MFEQSPILVGGLVVVVIFIIIIVAYSLLTGIDKTKEVEILDEANKFERKRKCPDDKNVMIKEIIDGIVIDKCPICESIFLDKNELDLIRKKSSGSELKHIVGFLATLFIFKS